MATNSICIKTEFFFSRHIEVAYLEPPQRASYWHLLLFLLIFLYHACSYPRWRDDRVAFQAPTKLPQVRTERPQQATDSPLRWIPYLPIAAVYLIVRAAWIGLRFAILYSLLAAEHGGISMIAAAKSGVQWSINHGPDIILAKVIGPILAVALVLWESPALSAAAYATRNRVIPVVVRVTLSCAETAQTAATSIVAWKQASAGPVRAAVAWIAVECVFAPMQALLARVAFLGVTFVLVANIYLHELAKDVHDLSCVVAKTVAWSWARFFKSWVYIFGREIVGFVVDLLLWPVLRISIRALWLVGTAVLKYFSSLPSKRNWLAFLEICWTKTVTFICYITTIALGRTELKLLGAKACTFGLMIVSSMADILLWAALRICIRVLWPTGVAVLEFFGSLLNHPVVLERVHTLSCKVKELCIIALQRLENVEWLNLWQTVMSKAIFLCYYAMLVLQYIGKAILVFATDILPSMYSELTAVLKVACLAAEWMVDDFVRRVHRPSQAMYEISWSVATKAGATLAWLHEAAMPAMRLWESKIQPVLSSMAATSVSHIWELTEAAMESAPLVATAAEHVWHALLKVVNVVQAMLSQVATRTVYLTGGLGERINSLAPQFESFKEQAGCAMDGLVVSASNVMMDWAKKEKRDTK